MPHVIKNSCFSKLSFVIYNPQQGYEIQFLVWGVFCLFYFVELDEDNIELALLQSTQVQSGKNIYAIWREYIL